MIMYEGLLFMKALSPPAAGVRIAAGILDSELALILVDGMLADDNHCSDFERP